MEKSAARVLPVFVDNGASSWWINGVKTTILVTLLALVIGVILGGIVGMIRSIHQQTGKLKILNGISMVYLTIIRGTPSMIQILIFTPLYLPAFR